MTTLEGTEIFDESKRCKKDGCGKHMNSHRRQVCASNVVRLDGKIRPCGRHFWFVQTRVPGRTDEYIITFCSKCRNHALPQ